MFCSKCGNPLPDDAKFCSACGAPVKISQEASPVPQQPAGITDEAENIQTPKPEPLMQEPNFNGQTGYGAAAPVQKKSKKGLIIGLSLGGVLLAVILAAGLIFVFGLKGGSKGNDGSINLGYSTVVYDDQYTYFLSETETWAPCIKRVSNDLSGQPEILYETEKIEGDGWSKYPLGALFLWNDKICFLEFTNATEQGDEEYEIHWLSKDGKENGTLVSYEQLNAYGNLLSQMEGAYFFDDYLIFGNRFFFHRLGGRFCRGFRLLGFRSFRPGSGIFRFRGFRFRFRFRRFGRFFSRLSFRFGRFRRRCFRRLFGGGLFIRLRLRLCLYFLADDPGGFRDGGLGDRGGGGLFRLFRLGGGRFRTAGEIGVKVLHLVLRRVMLKNQVNFLFGQHRTRLFRFHPVMSGDELRHLISRDV